MFITDPNIHDIPILRLLGFGGPCFIELLTVTTLVLLLILYPCYVRCLFGSRGRLPGRPEGDLVRGRIVETCRGRVRVLTTLDESRRGRTKSDLVVFVHGYAGTLDVWADAERSGYFDAVAARGYDVLAFDLLGHGFSDSPDSTFGADLFAAQLVELLYCLKLDDSRRVKLVAHSMGASPALLFAHLYPDRVSDVCFICPAVTMKKLDWKLRLALRIPYAREFFASLIIPTFGEGHNKGNPGLLRACYRLLETQLQSGGSWIEPRLGLRESDMLRSLHGKRVLFMWGMRDDVVPLNAEARVVLDAHLKDAFFAVRSEADHMGFADGSSETRTYFRDTLLDFLDHRQLDPSVLREDADVLAAAAAAAAPPGSASGSRRMPKRLGPFVRNLTGLVVDESLDRRRSSDDQPPHGATSSVDSSTVTATTGTTTHTPVTDLVGGEDDGDLSGGEEEDVERGSFQVGRGGGEVEVEDDGEVDGGGISYRSLV